MIDSVNRWWRRVKVRFDFRLPPEIWKLWRILGIANGPDWNSTRETELIYSIPDRLSTTDVAHRRQPMSILATNGGNPCPHNVDMDRTLVPEPSKFPLDSPTHPIQKETLDLALAFGFEHLKQAIIEVGYLAPTRAGGTRSTANKSASARSNTSHGGQRTI